MEATYEAKKNEAINISEILSEDERLLTEVNNLIAYRQQPNVYDPKALEDVYTNLKSAVMEAAMPYAVSRPEHAVEIDQRTGERVFRWLGKTAVEATQSGYLFHHHENARKRVDVEVEEAKHAQRTLRTDRVQVFISPRMSEKDATLEEARREHLAEDDAIRIRYLKLNKDGELVHQMESILVRDIPLDAWVSMLSGPNNIFGKAIPIDNPDSAISIMRCFKQLEIPHDKLPHGVVSILDAVSGYISDEERRTKLITEIPLFLKNQEEMEEVADEITERWLQFECEISESLMSGIATEEVEEFIRSLWDQWNDDNRTEIINHQIRNNRFVMTRKLAAIVERAKQNTLWSTAGVLVGNQEVLRQMKPDTAEAIRVNHQFALYNPEEYAHIERQNAVLLAQESIQPGRGCPGGGDGGFKDKSINEIIGIGNDKEQDASRDTQVKCVNCPSCKTFHETVKKEKGKLVCDNPDCKLAGSHAKKKKD